MERLGTEDVWVAILTWIGWTTAARLQCVCTGNDERVRRAAAQFLAQLSVHEVVEDARLLSRGRSATQRCFWVSVRRQAGIAATRWWHMPPQRREARRNSSWKVCLAAGRRDREISTRCRPNELQAELSVSRAVLLAELSAMLASGLDLNAPDKDGHTLLWRMCEIANVNVVRALLHLGASPTAHMPFGRHKGELPMHTCGPFLSNPSVAPWWILRYAGAFAAIRTLLLNAGAGSARADYTVTHADEPMHTLFLGATKKILKDLGAKKP
jgi:hypothetical protein